MNKDNQLLVTDEALKLKKLTSSNYSKYVD